MATMTGVAPAETDIDHRLREQFDAYRGKWVAFAPPSRFLGFGETALEAYSEGQAAGVAKPNIWRVPE
jgi:hypothetical protein